MAHRYNHGFDMNMEIASNEEDASDVTAEQIRDILKKRLAMSDDELMTLVNNFDTKELEPGDNVDAGREIPRFAGLVACSPASP